MRLRLQESQSPRHRRSNDEVTKQIRQSLVQRSKGTGVAVLADVIAEGEIRTERFQDDMFSGFPVLERFAVEARTLRRGRSCSSCRAFLDVFLLMKLIA